ncbi:MAG TPA: RNA 2',3'-cyclic phosphodiesterase [Polyangia bacterium]|nr:RNA 2',3'-cyclic phosphodiesterase [Polyangia bacterium]
MTEATSTLRSFVAVPLPGAVQTEIAEAARALAGKLPAVSWSKKPENLHVTIKFLGAVAVDRLEGLAAELGTALAEVPRFEIGLRGWGAFPSARHARVLFADVEGSEALSAAAEIVEAVAERFGFEREKRRFTGHVTVGRAKEKAGVDARAELERGADREFGRVTVEEVHVYESHLGREGSTYVLRHRAPLGGRAN